MNVKNIGANSLKHVIGAIRLVHPFPVSVVVAASTVILSVDHAAIPDFGLMVRVVAVVLLSQIPVGAFNDYHDRFLDAQVQPHKPIPSGDVPPYIALGLTLGSLVAIIPLAASFGVLSFVLITVGVAAGLAYDVWLKPTVWSFVAYVIGFLTLITWLWSITRGLSAAFLIVYPAAALVLVAAHLAQSLPDVESDRAVGNNGLATVLGPRNSLRVAAWSVIAVAAPVVAIATTTRQILPLFLAMPGLVVPAAGFFLGGTIVESRPARLKFFYGMAPTIACLGVSSLIMFRNFN